MVKQATGKKTGLIKIYTKLQQLVLTALKSAFTNIITMIQGGRGENSFYRTEKWGSQSSWVLSIEAYNQSRVLLLPL